MILTKNLNNNIYIDISPLKIGKSEKSISF